MAKITLGVFEEEFGITLHSKICCLGTVVYNKSKKTLTVHGPTILGKNKS